MENTIQHPENSIRMYTGKYFDLKTMDPDTICIEDIVHGLSNTMRFAGQLDVPYSVLQHSVLVADNVSKENQLAALLHDASEAYLGDMPSPFKKMLPDYKAIEDKLMRVIAEKFGFEYPLPTEVKEIDRHFLEVEWNAFVEKKLPLKVWTPAKAKNIFNDLFESVIHRREVNAVIQVFNEHKDGQKFETPAKQECYKDGKTCDCPGLCRESC